MVILVPLDSWQDGRQYVGLPSGSAYQQVASIFPAPWRECTAGTGGKRRARFGYTTYDVSYQRIDGETITFQMRAPDQDKPRSKMEMP